MIGRGHYGGLALARSYIHQWVWRYLPKRCRVYVARGRFIVFWVAPNGHVLAGACENFETGLADTQEGEIMRRIWRGTVKKKELSKMRGTLLHADPDGLKDNFPNLSEFMTAATFEEGEGRRESPTLTIWAQAGQWKCNLRDREEGLCMWLAAATLQELAVMLETFCLETEGPWRHDDVNGDRYKKRLKKGD